MSAFRIFKAGCLYVAIFSIIASSTLAAEFAGGTGEPNDPYQIATAEQLVLIGSDPNLLDKHFVLVNDIDLDPNLPGGQVFTRAMIAPDINDEACFQGIDFTGGFDGNSYIIRNLTIQAGTLDYIGLFGKMGECKVQNLDLENVSIRGKTCVGGLAGLNIGEVTNCFVTGKVRGMLGIGGLLGQNDGSINNCNTTAEVTFGYWIGGLVGHNWGIITDCHATGKVIGSGDFGGLIGENWGSALNCYATGEVSGTHSLGGLIGSNIGTIAYCYSTGDVSGSEFLFLTWDIGGLVGRNEGEIICCCASGRVTGVDSIGGLVGFDVNSIIINSFASGSVIGTAFSSSIGGLAGFNYRGTITNCYATGSVSGGDGADGLGGLVGVIYDSNITNCYATGSVSSGRESDNLGGLVGSNGGEIADCYSTAMVSGGDKCRCLGGLAGLNSSGHISNCYATGNVYGGNDSNNLGGLVGRNGNITGGQGGGGRGSAEVIHTGHITDCYSAGSVYGGDNSTFVGGLVGDNFEGTINNCFWDIEVSGLSESDGGIGLSTTQMKTAATFLDAGWDFVDEMDNGTDDIWKMPPWIGYPLLAWQEVEIPAPVPIAHWAFDEGSGDIATDSAGDNHGTIYNPEWAEGKINGALQFNGFNTYVDCGDSEVLGPEQMTLAMWLEPGHMGGMRYILSRANKSTDDIDYALTIHLTTQAEFTLGQLNTAPVSVLSNSTTPMNEWSHVAVSMDGSELSVYINGQLDTSAGYAERGPRQGHRLVLSSYQGSTRFFFGKLDDVRIYDTALSAVDIEALYTDGSQ